MTLTPTMITCVLCRVPAQYPQSKHTSQTEGVLDINGDRIRAKDWLPILNTVHINKTLEFLAVRSYYQQTLDDQEKRGTHIKRKPPAIRSKEITYRLCKALQECLSATPTLTCIELQGLPLRDRDLTALAKGLTKNRTLRHLSLEHSPVGDEGLDIICKGIKNSTCITSVNFTGCGLSCQAADTLAKIIKHQAMKRHNEAWQDSLRYRRPDLDRMSGIRRITVNCNPMLGDQGAVYLAEVLKDDLWLKALDLQQCGLSDVGSKALLDALKYNTTIVVLDVRQNPMIDQEVIRNIMEQVMINCNGQDTEYKWIKAAPIQDPMRVRNKKRRTKTLQSSFGRKTTIKVINSGGGSRKRSKSVGAVSRPLQPFNAEQVKPGPGMPWRTAMRAGRCRGYPPEHTPSKVGLFESVSPGSSPSCSPKHEDASVRIEYSAIPDNSMLSLIPDAGDTKQTKIEMEQLRRRLKEETNARAKAEERVIELTVECNRLRQEVVEYRARHGVLDDDRVLESIESSFKQVHSFLDLLRDAGLGQLITLAGLDESKMSMPRPSPQPVVSDAFIAPYPQSRPATQPLIDIRTPQDLSGYVSDRSLDNSYINGEVQVGNHITARPQNYQNTQDPTMQHTARVVAPAKSKFDELYSKVLQDAEGALTNPQGDTRETSLGQVVLRGGGGAGEPAQDLSLSERLQRSTGGQDRGVKQAQPHSSKESSPTKSRDVTDAEEQYYTETFERSQSDISVSEELQLKVLSDQEN